MTAGGCRRALALARALGLAHSRGRRRPRGARMGRIGGGGPSVPAQPRVGRRGGPAHPDRCQEPRDRKGSRGVALRWSRASPGCYDGRMSLSRIAPLLILAASAGSAGAATLHVPSEYATIQAAMNSAAPGDSVVIGPGVFRESVSSGTSMSVFGAGSGVTVLSADGAENCIRWDGGATGTFLLSGLTLQDSAPGYGYLGGFAVSGQGALGMTACSVGNAGGGVDWDGYLDVQDCAFAGLFLLDEPCVSASGPSARIEGCTFADGAGAFIVSIAGQCQVVNNRFERLSAPGQGGLVCPLWGEATVTGNLFADIEGCGVGDFTPPVHGQRAPGPSGTRSVAIEGNTFVRVLNGAVVPFLGLEVLSFHGNLVVGGWSGVVRTGQAASAFTCNDVWNNVMNWGGEDLAGQYGNVSLPPRFCDPPGHDYTLGADSPCLPENNGCGVRMGAFGEGCGSVGVSPSTWGQVKAAYREGGHP